MASPWEARPLIGRNMPDVTDVSLGKVWQPREINSVNSEKLTKKEKEHKACEQNPTSYPSSSMMSQNLNANTDAELKDSLKELNATAASQAKEETNPDNLIYMSGPCTEASLINVLRLRFTKNLFQVLLNSYNPLINSSCV
jgi:hypothetical protein